MSEVNQRQSALKKDSGKPSPIEVGHIKYAILKWGIAGLVLIALSAIWWWPRAPKIETLGKSQNPLEKTIKQNNGASLQQNPAEIVLEEKVKKLEKQLEEKAQSLQKSMEEMKILTTGSGENASQSWVQNLQEDYKTLEVAKVRVLLPLFKIRDAVEYGRPFESTLSLLREQSGWVHGIDDSLARLDEIAKAGAPTLGQLKDKLETIHVSGFTAFDLLHIKVLFQKIMSMVRFEKVDGAKVEKALIEDQLQVLLDLNDIEGVLKLIESVDATRKTHYDDWAREARLYQDVRDALDNILAHVIAQQILDLSQSAQNALSSHTPIVTGVSE
ncbi:MAG: hypothetical protein ACTHJ4_02925 [Candidatus Nucleicultricaceae bacterium]